MRSTAGQAIQRFFAMDAGRTEPPRPVFRTTTARRSETADLGESIATGVHAIYGPVRLYLCVSMEPKPEALAAQREADRRQAAAFRSSRPAPGAASQMLSYADLPKNLRFVKTRG